MTTPASFDWSSLPPPEAIAWPIYPEDSPARRYEESTEAFNEAAARAAFGDGCVDWLKTRQPKFRGDWWMLAMLLHCAHHATMTVSGHERFRHYRNIVGGLRCRHNLQWWIHLEAAYIRGPSLGHVPLEFAHLEHADMEMAQLECAHMRWSRLDGANLRCAKLPCADLERAFLKDSNLRGARLIKANLTGCELERADLSCADLTEAQAQMSTMNGCILDVANFDQANVRGAKDILFNDTKVKRLDIEGNAKYPWSVLRRKYTGPMFFVHLLLLVGFVLPYAAKVLTLTMTARGYDALRASLEAGQGAPPGGEVVRAWLEHFDASHMDIPAWMVLLGWTHDWGCIMVPAALAILCYNLLRGHLTLAIGVLRDQADRVHRTPTLEEYFGPCHPLAGNDAGWHRVPAVWWRRCKEWGKGERRWKNRGTLNPLPVIGPWYLHQFARVLFWISIASVALHVGWWLLDTTVPVPVPVSR